MRIARQRCRVAAIALALLAIAAGSARAQTDVEESELPRARVEQVRDDPDFTVRGVSLAARRALPQLYAHREFTRTWTDPEASAQLLSAIRAVRDDGLDPEDYLLSALEEVEAELARGGAALDVQVDRDLLLTDALREPFGSQPRRAR